MKFKTKFAGAFALVLAATMSTGMSEAEPTAGSAEQATEVEEPDFRAEAPTHSLLWLTQALRPSPQDSSQAMQAGFELPLFLPGYRPRRTP